VLTLFLAVGAAAQKRIVVATDGSGDFKTIQQALDHVPDDNRQRIVIQIKPGVYQEQIGSASATSRFAATTHARPSLLID
jgi:pectinesterase